MSIERLPQRFRYRWGPGPWSFGVCILSGEFWRVTTENGGHTIFHLHDDATKQIVNMMGRNGVELKWIDNDFGWKGTE